MGQEKKSTMYNLEDLGKKMRKKTLWVQRQLEQAASGIIEGDGAYPCQWPRCLGQQLCGVEEVFSHLGAVQPHPTCAPRSSY